MVSTLQLSSFSFVLLTVLQLSMQLRSVAATSMHNDICSNAELITSLPFRTTGNTSAVTNLQMANNPTDLSRNISCGFATQGAGVWYQLEGSDQFLQALVSDVDQQFRMVVAIMTGVSCNQLECFQDYSITNQRTQPTSEWFAAKGTTYYLRVAGVLGMDVGPFTLTIQVRVMYFSLSLCVCVCV